MATSCSYSELSVFGLSDGIGWDGIMVWVHGERPREDAHLGMSGYEKSFGEFFSVARSVDI
jgi:hypothetical protein